MSRPKSPLGDPPLDRDSMLVAALAAGASLEDAARIAHCSDRTVSRRLADPDFKARVADARSVVLERVLGLLADAAVEAVTTLRGLLKRGPASVKRSAAASILEHTTRTREHVELGARIAQLERELASRGVP